MGMTDEERHCEQAGQPFNLPSKPPCTSLCSSLITWKPLGPTRRQCPNAAVYRQVSGHRSAACPAYPCRI